MKRPILSVIFMALVGLVSLTSLSGCLSLFDIKACGLFGYSSSYDAEFIIFKELPNFTIEVEETISFIPENHIRIDYHYDGNPDCKELEYYSEFPRMNSIAISNDTLATVNDYKNEQSQRVIEITGIEKGNTQLIIDFEWTVEGNHGFLDMYKTLELPIAIK